MGDGEGLKAAAVLEAQYIYIWTVNSKRLSAFIWFKLDYGPFGLINMISSLDPPGRKTIFYYVRVGKAFELSFEA